MVCVLHSGSSCTAKNFAPRFTTKSCHYNDFLLALKICYFAGAYLIKTVTYQVQTKCAPLVANSSDCYTSPAMRVDMVDLGSTLLRNPVEAVLWGKHMSHK